MQVSTLAENIAAISAEFHQVDKETYDLSYDADAGGFTELWMICGAVGEAFTKAEAHIREVHGEDFFDWILAVSSTAEHIHRLLQGDNRRLVYTEDWESLCAYFILSHKH